MRFRASPLVVAVALGLLNPAILEIAAPKRETAARAAKSPERPDAQAVAVVAEKA